MGPPLQVGMDLPKRKQIRLKGYDYSKSAAYFVTICTYKRAVLFGDPIRESIEATNKPFHLNAAGEMIERWLHRLLEQFPDVTIDCYAILPDHIHFILNMEGCADENKELSLPRVLDWFKTMTTNEYIHGVHSGILPPFYKSVWQRGYFEHIVRKNEDMDEIRTYIQENPKKWQRPPATTAPDGM